MDVLVGLFFVGYLRLPESMLQTSLQCVCVRAECTANVANRHLQLIWELLCCRHVSSVVMRVNAGIQVAFDSQRIRTVY